MLYEELEQHTVYVFFPLAEEILQGKPVPASRKKWLSVCVVRSVCTLTNWLGSPVMRCQKQNRLQLNPVCLQRDAKQNNWRCFQILQTYL